MTTTNIKVSGMTCGHCVSAVNQELSAVAGVSAVAVELVPGGVSVVTITSDSELSDDAVSAGYELAD